MDLIFFDSSSSPPPQPLLNLPKQTIMSGPGFKHFDTTADGKVDLKVTPDGPASTPPTTIMQRFHDTVEVRFVCLASVEQRE